MEFKAKDIAALLGGVVDGDPEISVNNVSKIEEGKPGTLAFLANPKYEHYIYTTQASIVLICNILPLFSFVNTAIKYDM